MSKQFCTFTVAGYQLGVDVLLVQEVLRRQEMTPVPRAPEVIRGLINLRGQILTVLDLRRRLDLPAAPAEIAGMNVVFQLPEDTVCFLVDQAGEVLEVSADQFEPVPSTVTGVLRELILGVYKLEDSFLLILDVAAAAEISGTSSPARMPAAPVDRSVFSQPVSLRNGNN